MGKNLIIGGASFLSRMSLPTPYGAIHSLYLPPFRLIIGLDEELLAFVPQPVHAVILLFPCTPKYEEFCKEERQRIDKDGQTVSSNIVFYPQTIANACGTMGVLHSIANNWARGGLLKLSMSRWNWTMSIFRPSTID
jgi:ubiquitin carboxyl-terminal hydrolase L3